MKNINTKHVIFAMICYSALSAFLNIYQIDSGYLTIYHIAILFLSLFVQSRINHLEILKRKQLQPYEKSMREASSLEDAVKIGFDVMPLGSQVTGPKGTIVLNRNMISMEFAQKNIGTVQISIEIPVLGSNPVVGHAIMHKKNKNIEIKLQEDYTIDRINDLW